MNRELIRIRLKQLDFERKHLDEERSGLVKELAKLTGEKDPLGEPQSLSEQEEKARVRRENLRKFQQLADPSVIQKIAEELDKKSPPAKKEGEDAA